MFNIKELFIKCCKVSHGEKQLGSWKFKNYNKKINIDNILYYLVYFTMTPDEEYPEVNVKIIEACGFTQSQYNECKYTWILNNFSNCFAKNQNRVASDLFPKQPLNGIEWRLVLYLKGFDNHAENFVSAFAQVDSHDTDLNNLSGRVKIKILNFPSVEIEIGEYLFDWKTNSYLTGVRKYIDQEAFHKALTDDKLIVDCEIVTERSYVYSWPESTTFESRFARDFEPLFEQQDFSDVTLFVGGKTLKAHKAILAARSPIFNEMFNHDMKEELNANITDVKYEVLIELLRYIYTEKVQNLEKFAVDLLVAADKYKLAELKPLCEMASATIHLCLENAAELLIIAHKHRAPSLKIVVLNYIRTHSQVIVISPGWKTIMQEYPDLVDEAFCAVAKNSAAVESLCKRKKPNLPK